ncbi:MAG TPA: fumarylacetoacetate hydrolase [Burkholderiaceae bacterium]|nr:fumarylacetoacetate hydrolase [Burkholderiaceae bacterium]
MIRRTACAALALACLCAGPVSAACFSDAEAAALVVQFMDKQPVRNPEGLSLADGECTRTKVNQLLELSLGRPVGYKVALPGTPNQARFNAAAPVWGLLYAPMLLPDGTVIDPAFGARPVFEADLLVRVSDARINLARTPMEVLNGIDQVIPFVELSDLTVDQPIRLDGAVMSAINAGARLGVMGRPITVQRNAEFAHHLRDMRVVTLGGTIELDQGRGSDVLDHPLNAVAWLVQDLAREGRALKKGDLVSLGSFSALLPPKPGQVVTVRYEGLPGTPVVRFGFRQ